MKKNLLFIPGPVNVAKNVQTAICHEDICHRENEFENLLRNIENKLLKLVNIQKTENFRAVIITGSGTAANEAMLSSVVGDKKILILSNGEFGERLYEISKIHNKNTFILRFDWGEKLKLKVIGAYLKENEIDIVAMVHHETSSGMLNPLRKIGALSNTHQAMFIVDCVSSAAAEHIDMEKWNIAFCSSSSSKAISSYPGLSFVIGKREEFEKLTHLPVKTNYLNLDKFYQLTKNVSQTPNTPAVHLFYALDQALLNIIGEGVSNYQSRIKKRARLLRKEMLKLGLLFLIDQREMSSVLTTVLLPAHIDADVFSRKLRDRSIFVYGGKGNFKNKVFKVGNIGELSSDDILFFIYSLEEVLQSFNKTEREKFVSPDKYFPVIDYVKENI
ncbi:MAG: alanine--glyoxylate aminotransferase family protein [Chloroflexi bacterium]|nr:alanine--glyoxylate aminotransferase family protein [Chloroflexota bacterium]